MHLEAIAFQATQPNTGAAAAAAPSTAGIPATSLTIKNARSAAMVLALFSHHQTDGWVQLTYPTAHDTTRGLRIRAEADNVRPLAPVGLPFPLQPQELLSVQLAGSNTAGDVETGCALVLYENLPGVDSRLIDWPTLKRRTAALLTVEATITGTAAGWSGNELLTAESDLLRANRDYAVLGITPTVRCAALAIHGPDTGYQLCAVPGEPNAGELTSQWFPALSRFYDKPLIPVINSGNKSATYLAVLANENAGAVPCSVLLALLD